MNFYGEKENAYSSLEACGIRRPLTAIAAMAENRAIGCAGAIPWRIPEDFKFFKQTTMGGILLMGRKTFSSIGRALPGRVSVVISRAFPQEGARATVPAEEKNLFFIRRFSEVNAIAPERRIFVAGGAEIYRQLLPFCAELFLTTVRGSPCADAFFPEFESLFDAGTLLVSGENFFIKKYLRKK